MAGDVDFMELIEIHERRWGTKGYPGRPTLKELMESPIVAAWSHSGSFTLSAHENPESLNQIVTHLFTETSLDNRRLVKIFYKHKAMPFTLQVVRTSVSSPPKEEDKPVDLSRGATYQPEVVDTNPQRAARYSEVKEIRPAHYGQSAPARNELLPGRNGRLLKGRKTPRK